MISSEAQLGKDLLLWEERGGAAHEGLASGGVAK